jgi:hypothetical protein
MLASGCGGNDSNGGASTQAYDPEASTTLTTAAIGKAQFVKRANELCRRAWVEIRENWDEYSSTQDPKLSEKKRFEEAVQLSLLAGLDFHIFDEIRSLGAPRGEEQAVEKIIGPFQIAVELGWKNRWHAHSVAEVTPNFQEYNERARSYGLDACLVDEAHIGPLET